MILEEMVSDKYRICEKIASGGECDVYLARHILLGSLWVIKELKDNTWHEGIPEKIALRKNIDHRFVPALVDTFLHNGKVCTVEEYIKGKNLDEVVRENGKLDTDFAIYIANEICVFLKYMHSFVPPFIYRDMKPSNILLTDEKEIKITDMGTLRQYNIGATDDTEYLGTRGYASPEQYGSGQSDVRSDIYTVGATLFKLVTGVAPYNGAENSKELEEIKEPLRSVISKAMEQNPAERYQDISQLQNDLSKYAKISKPKKESKTQNIEKKPKAFTICGEKGSGSTITAVAMGLFLSGRDFKTVIVDTEGNLKLCRLFKVTCGYECRSCTQNFDIFPKINKNLYLIPFCSFNKLNKKNIWQYLYNIKREYDCILLKSGFFIGNGIKEDIINISDMVFIVKDIDLTDCTPNFKFLKWLESIEQKSEKINYIINKYINGSAGLKEIVFYLSSSTFTGNGEIVYNGDIKPFMLPFDMGVFKFSSMGVQNPAKLLKIASRDYNKSLEKIIINNL